MRKCVRCCLVIIIQNTTKMPDIFLAITDRDSPRGFADRNRSGQRILELLDGLAVLCCCSNIIKYIPVFYPRTHVRMAFIYFFFGNVYSTLRVGTYDEYSTVLQSVLRRDYEEGKRHWSSHPNRISYGRMFTQKQYLKRESSQPHLLRDVHLETILET